MASILPLNAFLVDQLQIGFIYQRGGLQVWSGRSRRR
jgi:hypothetical protein